MCKELMSSRRGSRRGRWRWCEMAVCVDRASFLENNNNNNNNNSQERLEFQALPVLRVLFWYVCVCTEVRHLKALQ